MKKLIKSFRHWRYRRLYRKLVFQYLRHPNSCINATSHADFAFLKITGIDYVDDVLQCDKTLFRDSDLISSPSRPSV